MCYCTIHICIQEQGVKFVTRGTQKLVFGTVAIVSADNLGSLALGGFKESCSAIKMCRHCMTTKDDSQKQVNLIHTYNLDIIMLLTKLLCSFLKNTLNSEIKKIIYVTAL